MKFFEMQVAPCNSFRNFAQIVSNNYANTVLTGFLRGVGSYGVPSWIHFDEGTKNTLVISFMEEYQGPNHGGAMTGQSGHYQRIECIWCDIWRNTTNYYYNLFNYMEHVIMLDQYNDFRIFGLHYVFILS